MKMRAPSRASAAMLRALGTVPVGMPIPKVYEALSRGVVEGTWIPWTIMRPFRLHEVTKYHTEVALSCALFLMTMNKKRYDGLPADIRKIVDDSTGMPLAKRLGQMWQDDEKPGRALGGQAGRPDPGAQRCRTRTLAEDHPEGRRRLGRESLQEGA